VSPTTVHNLNIEPMRDGDVYIGRAGKGQDGYFGNPFRLNPGESSGATIERFEVYARGRIANDSTFRIRVKELYGKRLFCFCDPKPCHGHVLARIAEELHSSKTYA
jgi:hypothetical protein